VITDGNYAVVTPIVSTFDLGIWLFSTSQSLPLLIYGAWYDSYAAAADVWELKAAIYAGHTDFSADGGNYSDSQLYDMAVKQAQKYRNMSCHGAVLTHLKRTDVRP
jgi:hypothetical protein